MVMGIFESIKNKKELEKLEKAAKEDPTSYNLTVLVKKYWEIGDIDNAIRIAKQALDSFPDVDEVFEIYSRLRKNQAQKEIEALKKMIEERPSPSVFAQIAEVYTDLRDEDTTLKYCRDSIEMFPKDDSAYLIIGELRLRRFYMDLLEKDGRLAMENLERAYEINNKNYKALISLAKFYLQIGMLSKAQQRLKSIALFAPEDDVVRELSEVLKKIPQPPHQNLDFLLQSIEDQHQLHYKLEKDTSSKITITPEIFIEPLEGLKEMTGVRVLLICSKSGNLINSYKKDDVETIDLVYEIGMSIFNAIQESSKQMDLGRFHKSELETPIGSFHFIISEEVIYIFLSQENVRRDQMRKHIQEFLVKVAIARLAYIHRSNS